MNVNFQGGNTMLSYLDELTTFNGWQSEQLPKKNILIQKKKKKESPSINKDDYNLKARILKYI